MRRSRQRPALSRCFEGTRPPNGHVVCTIRRADKLLEFILEASFAKIALLLCNPFLQAEVRFDHEFGHRFPSMAEVTSRLGKVTDGLADAPTTRLFRMIVDFMLHN